jgi:RimJ/RimL family protein N-acetyltransferase
MKLRREKIGTWRERIWLSDGRELLMRPLQPEDAEPLRRGFSLLSAEEIRMRFLHPITDLTPAFAKQLCDIDPQTGFALAITEALPVGQALVGGVARLSIDRETRKAEFALIVGRQIGKQGLGTYLLRKLIEHTRRRRLVALWGDVREDNDAMLRICDRLGFARTHQAQEPGVVRVVKTWST